MQPQLKRIYRRLSRSPLGPLMNVPVRMTVGFHYLAPQMSQVFAKSFLSREITNFTYDIDPMNESYLAATIAEITGLQRKEIERYFEEAKSDEELRAHIISRSMRGNDRFLTDPRCDFGRRLGWYAMVRAIRPAVVVETGIDKGLGSVLLCSALRRNGAGRYIGIDIDPGAGFLFDKPFKDFGEIVIGDSVSVLKGLLCSIDLFINDSLHEYDFELSEYLAIEGKISRGAVVLSDNSHCSDALLHWSDRNKRRFLFWKEAPVNHWYPGAGIGFSWK